MMISLHATAVHAQYVLQYGCCWTALDFTTTCTVHGLYCTFYLPEFHSSKRSASSENCIGLWSTRIHRQQSENSEGAQPLIEMWLWQTCQTSRQRAVHRAEGREAENWSAAWGLLLPPPPTGIWLILGKKKPCFTYEISWHMRVVDLSEVKLKLENFIEI